MNARLQITLDTGRLENALARFPRDRGMFIDGRAVKARGETIERHSPAHGALVTRMPRGTAADAEAAIAARTTGTAVRRLSPVGARKGAWTQRRQRLH